MSMNQNINGCSLSGVTLGIERNISSQTRGAWWLSTPSRKNCIRVYRRFFAWVGKYPAVHLVKNANLIYNLFSLYFVKIFMFRSYLGPTSGGTTVCIQQLVLIVWLSFVLVGLELCSNPTRTKDRTADSCLKRIINTNCCIHTVVPPDDGPRYDRNM